MIDIQEMGQRVRDASRQVAIASTEQKNAALAAIAHALRAEPEAVLQANAIDMEHGREAGLSAVMLDRLVLNRQRLEALAAEVDRVIALPDPVGEIFEHVTRPDGLRIQKRRVPFGVIGMIYEARPTVTVEAAAICIKSGNGAILRGGHETQQSNIALTALIQAALQSAELPRAAVQSLTDPDRALVRQMIRLDRYIDLLIPRGGTTLNQFCRQYATIPVITSGSGVCHVYVDRAANLTQAVPIIRAAKIAQPTACNTLEALLIDRPIAERFLPVVASDLLEHGVKLRVDETALAIFKAVGLESDAITPAEPSDFGSEFMALILAVRIVDGVHDAIEHIAQYGTGHSDAILTDDRETAETFVRMVDSSGVFVNASPRYNDAGELGLGTEIAVSNQKLHARGPMALRELTSYKWVVQGTGHVR
jgi:glutamate-5-semialdehyde dehydrogenase